MMEQLKVLRRIKSLREERMLRELTAVRREVLDADAVLASAKNAVRQSEATFPEREQNVFKPIIKQIVGFEDVEEAKANLQELQKEHTKLVDSAERAAHVRKRLQKRLDDAIEAHRQSMRERDKYTTLTDEAVSRWRREMDYLEEVENEDILIGRRGNFDG